MDLKLTLGCIFKATKESIIFMLTLLYVTCIRSIR